MASAEADFRANDRDGNRIQDFWTGDVAQLYGMRSVGSTEMIKLIEISLAGANFNNPVGVAVTVSVAVSVGGCGVSVGVSVADVVPVAVAVGVALDVAVGSTGPSPQPPSQVSTLS